MFPSKTNFYTYIDRNKEGDKKLRRLESGIYSHAG
jgi:hypothetical protein